MRPNASFLYPACFTMQKLLIVFQTISSWSVFMADWDGLIAQLQSQAKPDDAAPEPISLESNQAYEFGDLLESSVKQRVSQALEKAETNPVKIGPTVKKEKLETSGPNWFNVPKANLTEEEKRDWQLLHMRSALGRGGANAVELPEEPPEFLQFAVVRNNPIEGQKGRVSRKLRAPTIAESLAKDGEFRDFLETNMRKLHTD